MPTTFTCERGHRWEADSPSACPECGAPAENLTPTVVITGDAVRTTVETSTPADAAPRKDAVPGYEILEELGRGGMGVVYRARQLDLKRMVALKMVLAGIHAGSEEMTRFRLEAEAAARLQHANIVQVYAVGEHDGRPFFSLEYVDGGSLADRLRGLPQPPRVAAKVIETLARAMHYAHQMGIVHRDLKPANVLLHQPSKDGTCSLSLADWVPKITDFGLAKQLDSVVGHTRTGSVMGTPSYMAPEQAEGRTRDIGPATDVYALGAMLYEMLTGQVPFRGEAPMEILLQVSREDPVSPRLLNPKVPRDLETICLKCLAKHPGRRYRNALGLAEDLERFQKGEPIQARPTSMIERSVKWAKRRPAVATLIGVGALAAFILLVAGGLYNAALQRSLAESKQRLVRLTVASGDATLNDGDLLESLPWFAEALQLDHANRGSEEMHRRRIASVLQQCPRLLQLWFHKGRIYHAEFSPDGKRVLTASHDHTARIWDTVTGEPVGEPMMHPLPVVDASFSRDGLRVVTACEDGAARVWEAGKPQGEPMRHDGSVAFARFSKDGRRVLTVSGNAGHVWDPAAAKEVFTLSHTARVTSARFSPDGKQVITSSEDGTARIWDANSGKSVLVLKHANPVLFAAFSPDGQQTVTTEQNGTVRVWDAMGLEMFALQGHRQPVVYAAFSADGDRLVTASSDQTARVWDVRMGQQLSPLLRHGSKLTRASFSPDGAWVVTAADDNTARVWDALTGDPVTPPLKSNGSIRQAVFSPDGTHLLTASADGTVRLWDTLAGITPAPRLSDSSRVLAIAVSPDGRRIVTGSEDRTALVWNAETGEKVGEPMPHEGAVVRVAFSPDGKRVLTASADGTARVWDRDGTPTEIVLKHDKAVRFAAFSPDGKRIATACDDNSGCIWDTSSEHVRCIPLPCDGPVLHVAFSPDGSRLVTSSTEDKARVWNAETGEPTGIVLEHQADVVWAGFSPDGKRIVTASEDNTARIWETETGKSLATPMRHGSKVQCVYFSPDGGKVVTASDDNTARIWDSVTGRALTPPLRHTGTVFHAEFSPDGRFVATASEDHTARIWDVATGEPLSPSLWHAGPVTYAVFGPGGKRLITAGVHGRIWEAPTDDRPVEDLVLIAQVLSQSRIDATGGLVPMESEGLQEAWRKLRAKYPRDFGVARRGFRLIHASR